MIMYLRACAVVSVLAVVTVACVPKASNDAGTPAGPFLPTEVPEGGAALRPIAMISGLDLPTNVEFAEDGRVWIAEHDGTIRTFDSVNDPTSTLTVDLKSDVRAWADHGLLGMAIDPQFPGRPFLYVQYSTDPSGRWGDQCPTHFHDGCVTGARLERLTLDTNGVATGERVTLADNRWCYQFSSHGIGDLKFLPDGSLLSGSGEGSTWDDTDYGQFGYTLPVEPSTPPNVCADPPGAVGVKGRIPTSEGGAFRAQDILTPGDPQGWNGSIVRIDPDNGAPVADNPLIGGANPDDDHIVAHGFRNPYRFTVDPANGDVLVADVGWTAYEEVDLFNVHEGFVRNFGWPCKEGPYDQSGYTALGMNMCALAKSATSPTKLTTPLVSFWHNRGGAALSGIAVIAPGAYSAELDGDIAVADYVAQRIYTVDRAADGSADPSDALIAAEDITATDLQQAPDGYLYAVDIYAGTLVRLADSTTVPVAKVAASAVDGPLPLAVELDASTSVDPSGHGLTYEWDLDGDGAYGDASGAAATRTFSTPVNVTIGLRVRTTEGVEDTTSITIYPGNTAPVVTINVSSPLPFVANQQIAFDITAVDAEQGTLPVSAVSWSTQLQHCYSLADCHDHPIDGLDGSISGTVDGPSHEYPSFVNVTAVAIDDRGERTVVTRQLQPAVVSLLINSNPLGAQIVIGSETFTAPQTVEMIKGSEVTVSAISPQVLGGFTHVFAAWNDGGAKTHTVIADADKTVTVQMVRG